MREDLLREIQKLKDLEESYKQQSEVVIGAIERNYEKWMMWVDWLIFVKSGQ